RPSHHPINLRRFVLTRTAQAHETCISRFPPRESHTVIERGQRIGMKYAGLLVMPAGFFLAIAALMLFPPSPARAAFIVCGLAVQAMGLGVAIRGHMGDHRP